MKLVILGATGGIGRILVSNALEHGHDVTAFVRSPKRVQQQSPRLRVLGGNLFDQQQMSAAIRGSEAVISAFGPTTLGRTNQRCDFGRVLAHALRATGVSRVVHVSTAFLFEDGGLLVSTLRSTLFRNVAHDSANLETELMQPDLAWTIVRPPRLLNRPATGRARIVAGHLPTGGAFISRADVANFMLRETTTPRFLQMIVGISN